MRDGLVVAHCRPGFEAEALQDLRAIAARARVDIQCEPEPRSALVIAHVSGFDERRWWSATRDAPPIFVRAMLPSARMVELPGADRIAPILHALAPASRSGSVWLEHADSDEGRTLSALCRRLSPLLEARLRELGALDADMAKSTRLHVVFTSRDRALIGDIDIAHDGAWPMGIPRVRMPPGAPSRSTLKLAEAFMRFLGDAEATLLRPGMRAVDLGAAPGGWTWQLAYRGLRVIAVDNGPLKGTVADDPLVQHLREDGLTWRPRRPVDWMTCDIVESPARIAAVVARWIAEGHARRTIFNLKLPMKKRYAEVERCRALIGDTLARGGVAFDLRFAQLYHDREEVTGYLARLS